MEMKKTEVKMNKPIYLGQAILDISKTLMYEFWYDYIKPKYGDKARLCYTDTDSFIMHIKTDDFYKDINNDVDKWFDTSNYDKNDNRPLEIGKNRKVIGKFKDELGGKIMTEFCALRAKAYSFLIDGYSDDDYEKNKIINKKAKGTKKCIVKREIIFKNYVDAVLNDKVLIKSQQRFRSDHHKVYTEEVNKIALSSNDDKRIQTSDRITTYPYGMEIDVGSQKLIEESENTRKESAQIIASSQKLREELRVIREESLQIIDRSRKLRKSDKEIKDNDEEMAYTEMLNKMIDRVNEFKLTEFSYTSYINKVNEILIVLSDDDEIYEDPWLKLNELYNINALIDQLLEEIWKLATVRNKKADKKINIDKYLETDKYVDEYTDIIDDKIDLLNNLGLILTKATV